MNLGATYTKEKTSFKVWSPEASKVTCNLFTDGAMGEAFCRINMTSDEEGFWTCEKETDLNGVFYTYSFEINGKTSEAVDIYAKAVGVNGNRGMVVDLTLTNPEGFLEDKRPIQKNDTDAIIYEMHIRDFSIDKSSGIKNKGKFIGVCEEGTNTDGISTGLSHLKELGVTHVQILPSYDYATVDESKLDIPQYNWGYDPKNYNVPEGSYSTNPYDGYTRIREMKKMIMILHKNDIRVNMDVVFNHTFDIENSWFNKTYPGYYHRSKDGKFTNGSGCGNETASEKKMMRKYIVDSVCFWASEYHIDGFRFDLMAVHDLDTMKEIREALNKIDKSIMVYGEPWTGGESGLDIIKASNKDNLHLLTRVGAFNDDIRDGIKGNVFFEDDQGFINGKKGLEETIKFGVCGACLDFDKKAWANSPAQSINYISCHDNYTFWDKLCIANKEDSYEDRVRMNKLGAAIIFTSQGISFIHAGEEMLRSKPDEKNPDEKVENSYCSSDFTNSIKWNDKKDVMDVFEYYRGLIELRKSAEALRLNSKEAIEKELMFIDGLPANVVAFKVREYLVIYNANKRDVEVELPKGDWKVLTDDETAGKKTLRTVSESTRVKYISAMVLMQDN